MVSLRAPLSGVVWPLERIPDPVFAQKMVGDGASIDPTDAVLVAPCDGEVLALHPAGHAVTLRTAEGAEILLHIGIDTVALKGEGFHPMVSAGETVRVGAPLISFDLDYLATHAKSLLTQVVITNGHGLTNWERATGQVVAGKDLLFSVNFVSPEKAGATEAAETITSDAIVIPNPTGLHARPAAVLASLAKGFRSSIKLQLGDQQANARSITAIMALDVRSGAVVHLLASGPDARAAIDKIAPVIAQGLGDEGCTPAPAPATTTIAPESAPPPRRKSTDPNLLLGVPCSPGLAVGQVFQVRRGMIEVTEEGAGVETERGKLSAAIETAKGQLEALRAQLQAKADPAKAAIFAAHEELIEDPDLLEIVDSAIAKGKSAAVWLEESSHDSRRSTRGVAQSFARATRKRSARCRSARARDSHRRGNKGARLSAEHNSHRRRSHALRHGRARSHARDGICHDARRRDFARCDSRAFVRHSGARRRRTGGARSSEWHKRCARWQQRHAAIESASGRNHAHSQRAGASGEAAQGRSRARARAGGHARRQTH